MSTAGWKRHTKKKEQRERGVCSNSSTMGTREECGYADSVHFVISGGRGEKKFCGK